MWKEKSLVGEENAGPTEIWTRIAGFKVQSANHYTMGPYLWNWLKIIDVFFTHFLYRIFFLFFFFNPTLSILSIALYWHFLSKKVAFYGKTYQSSMHMSSEQCFFPFSLHIVSQVLKRLTLCSSDSIPVLQSGLKSEWQSIFSTFCG